MAGAEARWNKAAEQLDKKLQIPVPAHVGKNNKIVTTISATATAPTIVTTSVAFVWFNTAGS